MIRGWQILIVITLCSLMGLGWSMPAIALSPPDPVYEYRSYPHSDGIGKLYMGREIAQVMGHQGAGWLERASREAEEQPQQLIEALNLQPTDVVADIGAGTGYFSFRIAPLVPQGKVLAIDVQPEMNQTLAVDQSNEQSWVWKPIPGLCPPV